MAQALSPVPIQDFEINSVAAVGAQVFIYAAGTTTKITTYTDSTGATQQTNPVKLNSRGEPQNTQGASVGIWVPTGILYKMVFAPSTDTDPPTNPIWTVDNISSGGSIATSYATFNFSYSGSSPPGSNAFLGGFNIPLPCTIGGNFTTTDAAIPGLFHADTTPNAIYVMSVLHNGVSFGTISVSTGGVATFSTTAGAAVVFAQGDRLELFGAAVADAALNNFFVTLAARFN